MTRQSTAAVCAGGAQALYPFDCIQRPLISRPISNGLCRTLPAASCCRRPYLAIIATSNQYIPSFPLPTASCLLCFCAALTFSPPHRSSAVTFCIALVAERPPPPFTSLPQDTRSVCGTVMDGEDEPEYVGKFEFKQVAPAGPTAGGVNVPFPTEVEDWDGEVDETGNCLSV